MGLFLDRCKSRRSGGTDPVSKGPWTEAEDKILTECVEKYGDRCWRQIPKHGGLLRDGKSCRLRWKNYLKPGLKRGKFSKDEDEFIITLHALLGNRWSLIAGRIPGRTDNEIKNHWNTHLKKRLREMGIDHENHSVGLKLSSDSDGSLDAEESKGKNVEDQRGWPSPSFDDIAQCADNLYTNPQNVDPLPQEFLSPGDSLLHCQFDTGLEFESTFNCQVDQGPYTDDPCSSASCTYDNGLSGLEQPCPKLPQSENSLDFNLEKSLGSSFKTYPSPTDRLAFDMMDYLPLSLMGLSGFAEESPHEDDVSGPLWTSIQLFDHS
ncbi:uncharacterized protein [Physcomitrium patens]|uniref:Uncharacterized protein n=1 Tax=Physcomitrium patens TaxID=3218 RepID=A0A2K1JKV9_PHYPA|nr:transcription factor MYB57-like [Physcomitrium patens]PNR42171.1 hypothetical protein PHYPA_017000 [Physcomitrium patens]|eukprot:XP_024393282.1 transcription factor MYB57-like [Physcomitrella patens]